MLQHSIVDVAAPVVIVSGGSLQHPAPRYGDMAASDDTRLAALHATWHDIQPVLDTPANANVVAIRYTPYHEALLQYLRTVVDMPERSQRVLDLTTEVGAVHTTCRELYNA